MTTAAEFNLQNSIVVTPVITSILKEVAQGLEADSDEYICNLILHPQWLREKSEREERHALQRFIAASLKVDSTDSETADNATLYGWLSSTCLWLEEYPRQIDVLDLAKLGRKAWVAKLLYLIEVKDAVRLYSDGSYLDADWRYLPNGEPGWMRGDLPQ